MKSTGIVRKVDELGRITLPIDLRRTLDIKTCKEKGSLNKKDGDALEIFTDGYQIILKKYEPSCIFCGDARDVINYKGKNLCSKCINEIQTSFK